VEQEQPGAGVVGGGQPEAGAAGVVAAERQPEAAQRAHVLRELAGERERGTAGRQQRPPDADLEAQAVEAGDDRDGLQRLAGVEADAGLQFAAVAAGETRVRLDLLEERSRKGHDTITPGRARARPGERRHSLGVRPSYYAPPPLQSATDFGVR